MYVKDLNTQRATDAIARFLAGADEVDGIYAGEVRIDDDKVAITFADDNGDTVTAHAQVLSIDFSEIE